MHMHTTYISVIVPVLASQSVLMDTLPNIISISWQSHAGDDHLQVAAYLLACCRAVFTCSHSLLLQSLQVVLFS